MPDFQEPELRVRDVFDPKKNLALIVEEATPFVEVVRRFAERPELRGIFVVDRNQRLTGVVTRADLLTWASVSIGPHALFTWKQMYRMAKVTTAKEAAHPYSHLSAVKLDDPLQDALSHMVGHQLIDVPVVDDEGRILGDLRLTVILEKALDLQSRRPKGKRG